MKSWVLTDQSERRWLNTFEQEAGPFTIRKETLQAGLSQGVDLLSVSNGVLSLDIIPTRGMNIWQGFAGNFRLGWDSPVKGPVHPSFVRLEEIGGIGWVAGFDEWIARCGLAWMGAPIIDKVRDPFGNEVELSLPLHGCISNRPAHFVEVVFDESEDLLTIYGVVDEAVFHGQKLRLHSRTMIHAGSCSLEIQDTIQNIGGAEQEFQILYHTNFGPPFAEDGVYLEGAFTSSEPRDEIASSGYFRFKEYGPPTCGKIEEVFFHKVKADRHGRQKVCLVNKEKGLSVCVDARERELPFLCQWKNEVALADGYVTGIEFGSGYPTGRSVEREAGRVNRLAAGEEVTTSMIVSIEGA